MAKKSIDQQEKPLDRIVQVIFDLEKILEKILYRPMSQPADIEKKILTLINELIDLCQYHTNAVLRAIHIDHQHRYAIIHALHQALLCYLVARRIPLPPSNIQAMMGAALTANIGMIELQDSLQNNHTPLSTEQRKDINSHPMRSIVLLKQVPIKNKLWLDIILQHHERINGTGYPRQLKNNEFIPEARILALADRYHAMVSPRNYRPELSPTEALHRLFRKYSEAIDDALGLILIKEVGIHLPNIFAQSTRTNTHSI